MRRSRTSHANPLATCLPNSPLTIAAIRVWTRIAEVFGLPKKAKAFPRD
jgi:hypothetical protein